MKKLHKAMLLASAGAALVASQAQATPWTVGDAVLDLRLTAGGGNDITVDLGAMSQFTAPASAIVFGNLSSLLSAANGADPLSAYSWSVLSSSEAPSYNLANTGTTAPTQKSASNDSGPGNKIQGILNGATSAYSTQGTLNGYKTAIVPDGQTSAPSYGYEINSQNLATSFNGLETSGAGQANFFNDPSTTHGSVSLLGYFSLDSSDNFEFTPVPEPMTYGLLSGFGLLAVSLRRQFGKLRA